MEKIKSKINIIDDKINLIGRTQYSLSKNWFRESKNKLLIEQLKKNLLNYFQKKVNGKSKDNMWATYKDFKGKLIGKGYTKGFVSLGCRATNDYCDKSNLAYCANIFVHPIIYDFFKGRGITINQDIYALSELIQWIWRSRIRKGEEINLYIPSSRMRRLLKDWLEGEDIG